MLTENERFIAKVYFDPSGCWLWRGASTGNGYGQFWWDGKRGLAHRYSYLRRRGPIPDGMQIDHLCRNRSCVNPAHLAVVTQKENILRGISEAAYNAKKTHCKHGHPFDESNTRIREGYGRECIPCSRQRHRKPQTTAALEER